MYQMSWKWMSRLLQNRLALRSNGHPLQKRLKVHNKDDVLLVSAELISLDPG